MSTPTMTEKNNGGPAFPILEAHGANSGMPGMTLRDYFIAHIGDENQAGDEFDFSAFIKSEIVGRPSPVLNKEGPLAVLQFEADFRAKWRVMRADAMLRARDGS